MAQGAFLFGPDNAGRIVAVERGRVLSVDDRAPDGFRPGTSLGGAGLRLGPGRVNAHTHLYSALAPFGMPEPKPKPANFPEILERVWWRLDRALDEKSLRAAARLYVAEALLAGTTTLVDHHESPNMIEGSLDILADACHELGARAFLCYGATERNGGRAEAQRGLKECARFMKFNTRPLVRGAIGVHASFTVSDDTLREAGRLCRDWDTVLHIHIAEDEIDVTDAHRRGYPGPLERLIAREALLPESLLAHGVHLEPDQVRRASDIGCWFLQNPRSNRGNGVGWAAPLSASRRVALGTDGYPARMDDEALVLREEGEKHGEASDIIEARVTTGWEMCAGLFRTAFAPLQTGGAADVVAWRGDAALHVMVGGQLVVRDGRLLTGDITAIRDEAREIAPRLWERMESL